MFGNNNKGVDKVNMSLDDIIKLNKKENKQTKTPVKNNNTKPQGGNFKRNGQQNPQGGNFKRNGQQNPQSSGRKMNRARSNGANVQLNQQAVVTKKPFGMLNKSKTIQKSQKRPNNQRNITQRNPMQAQFVGNRRRKPNNNNRANNNNTNKSTVFNRFGKGTPASKITIIKPAPIKNNTTPVVPRSAQPKWGRNATRNVANNNTKVMMQSARKNVQKAKRVLNASKKPTTQLMTQHFATKIGLASKFGIARVRPTKPLAHRPIKPLQQPKKKSILNQAKSKLIKVNIANKRPAMIKQQQVKKLTVQATKRPILNRARPQGASGLTSSRMVFL